MIAFNDLNRSLAPYKSELISCAEKVIESGWFVLGENVGQFEQEFAQYIGVDKCLGVANGTDGLEIALRAVGVEQNDEVITVANAGFYSTTACNQIGAVPIYVDIDEHLLISATEVSAKITPKTRAIVVTHLYGQAVDINLIRDFTRDIPIVEDCSQAHGATINSQKVGSQGDISVFSFYPTKNLGALGDGGAICTSNDDIATQVSMYRQYGWSNKYESVRPYGKNSRLDELQASFLKLMLKHLDENNENRQQIVNQYTKSAPSFFQHLHTGSRNVAHIACAMVPQRDEFRTFCKNNRISTEIHFPILDSEQIAMKNINFRAEGLYKSIDAQSRIISLPCYPHMKQRDIDTVSLVLSKWEDQFPIESKDSWKIPLA